MICQKCDKPNRPTAKYCKWCGAEFYAQPSDRIPEGKDLDVLFDKVLLRQQLEDILKKARAKAEFCKRNGIKTRMQLSFAITGEPGTGKTTVARTIASALHSAGIVKTPVAEIVNPVDYDEWIKNIEKNASRLGNSVVVFEEAQKLVPEGEADSVARIDHILQAAARWREDPEKPVVIITGNARLKKFFDENPNSAVSVNFHLATEELSVEGLMAISRYLLNEKYHRRLSAEAEEKLRRIFINDRRKPECALGAGGHNAASRAYHIDLAALGNQDSEVGPQFVTGEEFIPKTIGDVIKEFDRYVGVDEIKNAVMTIATGIENDVRAGREPKVMHHYRFLGNPGTGKTTMARLFADALNALGALPVGHLVEVSKDDLVSGFVGDTSSKVVASFKKAMGGVLFIDEAYQLGNDSHGKDAIDTLLALAENNLGKIVVIIAGYSKEMNEFVTLNSGIASRFDTTINFPDYTADELTEIFRRMVRNSPDGITLDEEVEKNIGNIFNRMYLTRTATFGNAREVRSLFIKAVERMNMRLKENPSAPRVMTMRDIEGDNKPAGTVEDILAELDDMTGMASVKDQLRRIARTVQLNRRRALTGRASSKVDNIHIAITGNPGTGKTEIAKRLGRIFKAMGVLSKGHVVERERKTLLDSYSNSAGANMDKAVDEAIGGVLFIDEAYNLIPMNNPADRDADGSAAVEALMTRMSNDAGKFVTVIAGYKVEIDEFIANANPGLARRFTHRIHLNDYSVADLKEIFLRKAKGENFTLTPEADALLEKKIQELVTMKDKNFGNAGTVIKLFNETLERQSDRLGETMDELTDDQLFTIEASDIPYDSPKKVDINECFRELDKLVGLKGVKDTVRRLADVIIIEQERAAAEGRQPVIPMSHYLFLGNPGTGKTTVARIMGNIFYSLGVLPSNKLVEIKPSDMVAPYVGQTGPKTRQMIERGLGGVLFIDEAYGLDDGGFGARDAMPELLTLLNDYRGRMVCIAAGYPREMQQWINLNSGLDRRFDVRIQFEDYSADELSEIFMNILNKEGMKADEAAVEEMKSYFRTLVFNKSDNFGNAAEAVKYYNQVKINQGARLRSMREFDREELYTFRREDMKLS